MGYFSLKNDDKIRSEGSRDLDAFLFGQTSFGHHGDQPFTEIEETNGARVGPNSPGQGIPSTRSGDEEIPTRFKDLRAWDYLGGESGN